MMVNIPIPNINSQTIPGQIEEIKRYMYQLTETLNFALNSLEKQLDELTVEQSDTKAVSGR